MRKSILLVWTSFLSACVPMTAEVTCRPSSVEAGAWASTQKAGTADAYRKYLSDYPDGCFVDEATSKLKKGVLPPKVKKVAGGGGATRVIY